MSNLLENIKNLSILTKSSQAKVKSSGPNVKLYYIGRNGKIPAAISQSAPLNIKKKIKDKSSVESWLSKAGPIWIVQAQFVEAKSQYGFFAPSAYSMARDLMGTCLRQISQENPQTVTVEYIGIDEVELQGLCVGIEMGQYHFKKCWPKLQNQNGSIKIKSSLKENQKIIKESSLLGESINLARFLVDLPPNILNTKNYAEFLKSLFSKNAKTKVNLWNEDKLKKENMGLHVAVGQGAKEKSYLVHIEYRGGKGESYAFVGKGITFDTGGLDIKPSGGMRIMKKDMGGSAAVAGLAHWVIQSKLSLNCDFYFAIAENSVDEASFRPGDILTSRLGKTVEIHNTDAEGRLVLADALTVACEKKPKIVIDIATLTGAIKHGLGEYTPGLFSNDDQLAETLLQSGKMSGDVVWRMPLVPEERMRLKSDVADLVNCGDGFGGAVVAALFLEYFTAEIPWAHFDIYGWVGRPKGPYASAGGSGQMVQALAHFLTEQASNQN
jgi:leucyl aminopeptidase